MKTSLLSLTRPSIVGLVVLLASATAAQAENLEHVRKLLSTNQCQSCDLSGAGLITAQLRGANLAGANLAGANLSQANLAGADLTGANLAGASLYGANLSGAKFTNANLSMVDLRNAYLLGADLNTARLDNAMMQGVSGLTNNVGNADDFYRWAMESGKKKQYEQAIENFTQAITRKPDLAPAYVGRAMARLELGDRSGAILDSEQASALFITQGDIENYKTSLALAQTLRLPTEDKKPKSNIGQSLISVVGGLLQLFLTR